MNQSDELSALVDRLPDLAVWVRRDGLVQGACGGDGVGDLRPSGDPRGRSLDELWPEPVAALAKQLVRKAIGGRAPAEGSCADRGRRYQLRVTALGPDRAVCVVRAALDAPAGTDAKPGKPRLRTERRQFLKRLRDTLAEATIREQPAALAVVDLDGIDEIARVIDADVAERVVVGAIGKLSERIVPALERCGRWYVAELGATRIAIVLGSDDRELIEAAIEGVCTRLREPVTIGDAAFQLDPYAGVAVLRRDSTTPRALIDGARAAAADARRTASARVQFYGDTTKLRALARLDVVRELRQAIEERLIRLRYTGRYDLASGHLTAAVGYLRWIHPLRGEVRPAEFLALAETTGLAVELSRCALRGIREDCAHLAEPLRAGVRISFGALRHHCLHRQFVDDVAAFLADGALPAHRLELRIAERTFLALDAAVLLRLRALGVRLVVDEVGRGMGSFTRLASAPVWGLQLDRAWVTALRSDQVAQKVCRAGIGAAVALGLTPIATGVDDALQRQALIAMGCRLGSGDFYSDALPIAREAAI